MLYECDIIVNNNDSYMSALLLEVFMVENKVYKDSIIEVFNSFSNRIKISNVGKNIADLLRQYEDPINVGELAPDFTAPSLDGGSITLSENLGKVTLIDFWAAWCGPCRMLMPAIEELSDENAGSAKVGKINIDEHSQLAQDYGVESIPTLIVFNAGEISSRFLGVQDKAALQQALDEAKG